LCLSLCLCLRLGHGKLVLEGHGAGEVVFGFVCGYRGEEDEVWGADDGGRRGSGLVEGRGTVTRLGPVHLERSHGDELWMWMPLPEWIVRRKDGCV
jgi:hypothetical protein